MLTSCSDGVIDLNGAAPTEATADGVEVVDRDLELGFDHRMSLTGCGRKGPSDPES